MIRQHEEQGKIDPTSNLVDNSIYIFSGANDDETPPKWQNAQKMVYEQLGVEDLHFVSEDVDHYYGKGYMLPGLKQIYTDLGYDFSEPTSDNYNGQWVQFNQREFVGVGFDDVQFCDTRWRETGQVFIPDQCYTKTCRLHLTFHGCLSNSTIIAYRADYESFAAKNDIILLDPDSYCWGMDELGGRLYEDGVSDSLYIQAVENMICRLTSAEDSNNCEA